MNMSLLQTGSAALWLSTLMTFAQGPDLGGKWLVTVSHHGAIEYGTLTLKSAEGRFAGEMFGDAFSVALSDGHLEVRCQGKDSKGKECGLLKGRLSEDMMEASGTLYEEESSWRARKAPAIQRSANRHEFVPEVYYNEFSARFEPALRINPGDTVHTRTVDAGGMDADGIHRAAGGNPLTGPFYIEGAWPGDTLAIRLDRVRLNRDTAGTYSDSVVLSALDPYYVADRKKVEDFDSTWKLDREKGIAVLTKPTDRLKNFQVKLAPMLGCIGVAPGGKESFRSGRLGNYGGNMDYNQIRQGTTVYLPVFQPGALLFVGDGHAAQGDGELNGNALETSMDVEFTVDVIHGKRIRGPRVESANQIVAVGLAGSLDDAFRAATAGMAQWLTDDYGLTPSELAQVLGTSAEYKVSEAADRNAGIVLKINKERLSTLKPAAKPKSE